MLASATSTGRGQVSQSVGHKKMYEMQDIIIKICMALLAASLSAWFAIQTYYRQREYELILSRYLEGSLDLLAGELSNVSEIFSHNWARCLAIIKSYRDLEDDFDLSELNKGFIELQSSRHNPVAHQRLYTLTGTHDYWRFCQEALAYFTSANSTLVHEITEAIRAKLSTNIVNATHSQVVEHCFSHAKEQNDESHRYLALTDEYSFLSSVLESKRYRFKTLKKFRNNAKVKESIQRIKTLYASLDENTSAQQGA